MHDLTLMGFCTGRPGPLVIRVAARVEQPCPSWEGNYTSSEEALHYGTAAQ